MSELKLIATFIDVLLSIDVGSSSIRCTAYEIQPKISSSGDGDGDGDGNNVCTSHSYEIKAIQGCASSRQISCVEPDTGHIILTRKSLSSEEEDGTMSIFDDIDSCVDGTVASLRTCKSFNGFRIKAVGITSFVMNLIGINKSGQPSGKDFTLSYACNTSNARKQCYMLKEVLGIKRLEAMYQRTGTPLHTAYAMAQLKDIYERKQNNPLNKCEDDENVKVWLSISSICISRWTNANILTMPISYSEASWTGMLDFRSGRWDPECLGLLSKECRESLPEVRNDAFSFRDTTDMCSVKNSFLERWPEMGHATRSASNHSGDRCLFFSGFGDGACANIGTKCTSTDRIAVTIGTSAAARICIPMPLCDIEVHHTEDDNSKMQTESGAKRMKLNDNNYISNKDVDFEVPFGLFCYRIDSNTVLLGGALTDGGSVIAWMRDLFNLQSESAFLNCLSKVDESYNKLSHNGKDESECTSGLNEKAHNLVFLPFLSGERSTGYRENANGCLLGLTRSTTCADLLQESMESVVLRIHAIVRLIQKALASDSKDQCIVTSGNALEKNALWRQMLSDCSNMSVVVDSDGNEGTSRGAALLVAKSLVYSSSINILENHAIVKEPLMIKYSSNARKDYQSYWTRKNKEQEALINKVESLWS